MKIHLRELTDQETELDFNQDERWLLQAVERVDETDTDPAHNLVPKRQTAPRSIRAHFSLRKVDDVVVLNGNAETHVSLICSRCAMPFQFETSPRFSSLFCQDPDMAGVAHVDAGKRVGQNKGFARHAHDFRSDANASQDLDITYLAEEYIDLGDVLTEQLRLLLPFQPLCREDCKGICAQCGADLNLGRCACAKIAKTTPFSMLKNLKVEAAK